MNNPIKYVKRGTRGRFVSKKNQEKILPSAESTALIFYGKTVRKFVSAGKAYFAIEDILALAAPKDVSVDKISFTDNYDYVKQKVVKMINQIEVADADGILKLIREVVGIFPGPLERWLKETSD